MINNNYVIGGGPAGLITAYYSGYKIIDNNPLGQLGLRFIPGVRVFKVDEDVRRFLQSIWGNHINLIIEKIKIGFDYNSHKEILPYCTDAFKRMYSLNTRGKEKYEQSFLSGGETEFDVFTISGMDANVFYVKTFQILYENLCTKGQVIFAKVKSVQYKENMITIIGNEENRAFVYDKLISTVRADILEKLMYDFNGLYLNDYTILTKNFYKCIYQNPYDIENAKHFNYVYSISSVYTRSTYFSDYIVYETTKPLIQGTPSIFRNDIEDRYENVPLQLKNSLNLTSFNNIKLIGRFATWSHSIKANEIIKQCQQTTF